MIAGCLIALCCLTPGSPADDRLMSVSSGEHGWFIVDRSAAEPKFELNHYAQAMDGPYDNRGLALSRMPAAMAAWGDQLWLIIESNGQREVFTVHVHLDPVLHAWQYHPPDRLRAVAVLDSPGRIIDAAGTPQGPLVLLRPSQRSRAGVRAAQGSVAAEPVLEKPALLHLDGRRWREVPLPAGFDPTTACRLVCTGPEGRRILLLDESTDPGLTAAHWSDGAGNWSRSDEPLAPGRLLEVTSVGPAIAVVLGDRDAGAVEVAYLRPWRLLPLAEFQEPADAWTVFGLTGGPVIVELSARRELSMRRIDPVTGVVGGSVAMIPQPVMVARVLHRPLLFALAVTALMVVLLFRPEPGAATVGLPPTLVVMPLPSRLLAVCIDLGLGGALTLVILRCPARDLLDVPLWSTDLTTTVPYLVAAAITVGHSTLTELATGTTAGKKLMRGRVVGLDGSRPGAAAILIRNGFKMLVLLIPVLAVAPLLNPNAQGLGDTVARTVVVTAVRRGAEDDPDDR